VPVILECLVQTNVIKLKPMTGAMAGGGDGLRAR
jgi:hypothetical protein